MKNTNILLTLLAILLIGLSTSSMALAKDGGRGEGSKGDSKGSKVEIKIKNEAEEENELEEDEQVQQVEVGATQFEIRGEITAIVGNNFMVAGQTIFLDPSQVSEFEQKGILAVGKQVKVEGVIKNDVKFAREIKVIGEDQGRFKFEIKGTPLTFSTAPSLPTSSLTISSSPSASPASTSSANFRFDVKARGTVDQISTFLQQILTFLQNLTK